MTNTEGILRRYHTKHCTIGDEKVCQIINTHAVLYFLGILRKTTIASQWSSASASYVYQPSFVLN